MLVVRPAYPTTTPTLTLTIHTDSRILLQHPVATHTLRGYDSSSKPKLLQTCYKVDKLVIRQVVLLHLIWNCTP